MVRKGKEEEVTRDPSAVSLIAKAREEGVEIVWDRYEAQAEKCAFGSLGICCRNCNMGPCRLVHPELPWYLKRGPFAIEAEKGVCGASYDTIVARNLARMVASGAAAHSEHGRDIAFALLHTAEGKTRYAIKGEEKLRKIAKEFGIETNGRRKEEIARDVATHILEEFGTLKGKLQFSERAPQQRKEIWKNLGIIPRGIDREIVELMHRTHIGVDNDYQSIILQILRTSLADGWGGSMVATELSDILFGVPRPVRAKVNLGVLEENKVNIVVHGHEPTLSEMIADAVEDEEMLKLAESVGAEGINLCGICCTANEILMRRGIPVAGNFLNQELALITGAVEAMIVDVQCIMPSLPDVAKCYHTLFISTSPKARFPGAVHIEFEEERGYDIAKEIVRKAVENFRNRRPERVKIPSGSVEILAGFSVESILEALGGSLKPLLDALKDGGVRGIAALVGCNNPKVRHDYAHVEITKGLIARDVLVVETGCSAIACAKAGLMLPESARFAGDGLREFCNSFSIPPVLHMGSCVDISRILVLCAEIARSLGVDIADLPVAAAAPEWMSEKAVSIAAYVVASGILTVLGVEPPILGSGGVVNLLTEHAEKLLAAKIVVEKEPKKAVEVIVEHIEKKRKALGF